MAAIVISRRIHMIGIVLAAGGLCQISSGQTSSSAHLANQQAPSYEVATIKPSKDGEGFPLLLRDYILSSFGLNLNASRQLIGPDWISKTSYEIHGKPSESVRDAMNKMTPEEKSAETQLMMQSLLADRFMLKYHIEMREMKVYNLVLAKGGSKLKEDSDRTKSGAVVKTGEIKVTAVLITTFIGLLTNDPELEGLPVVDKTGLAGAYDFSLAWTPLKVANGANDPEVTSKADEPSIFKAVEEQLGLRLMASKGLAKVVVIDHIEPPSEN